MLKTPGVSLSSVGGNLDVTGSPITSNDFDAKNGTGDGITFPGVAYYGSAR